MNIVNVDKLYNEITERLEQADELELNGAEEYADGLRSGLQWVQQYLDDSQEPNVKDVDIEHDVSTGLMIEILKENYVQHHGIEIGQYEEED